MLVDSFVKYASSEIVQMFLFYHGILTVNGLLVTIVLNLLDITNM